MTNKENEKEVNDSANKPVNVINCKNYIDLKEPKSMGFGNKSKNINDINDAYSHNVVDYYGP